MSSIEVRRPDLEQALARRARAGPPLLLTGPPGAGKTSLLFRLRDALAADGWLPVYLDLMGAASSPDRFVLTSLDVLPAGPLAARLPDALRVRQLATAGRQHSAEAVHALFALWTSLDEAGGRPVALLLDEATEIRSLAYFPGLREVAGALGVALSTRRRGTILATSFPTLARRFWPEIETLEARPIGPSELLDIAEVEAGALVRLSFGWPRYARVLLDRPAGHGLLETWCREMAAGGRLEAACRHTHESLLLRSRGYGISKAVLAAVAREEGLNLTALVERLGRTPGATRDYLQWLVGVDALRMVKKRYGYVDGLLRLWVTLHARGLPPAAQEIEEAGRSLLARPSAAPRPAEPPSVEPPSLPEHALGAPVLRRDTLIEID